MPTPSLVGLQPESPGLGGDTVTNTMRHGRGGDGIDAMNTHAIADRRCGNIEYSGD